MAHAARTGELAEGLVTSITGKTKNDSNFKRLTDQAARGLKDQSHARTNPFEIREKLGGLVEKFSVLNREDLADALQARLDELPARERWLPEILSLLLELSDRPVEKAKVDDLAGLAKDGVPPADLTWEDIIADDPLNEEGIWDDTERGYHSSGDDVTVDDEVESELTTSTQATSLGEDDFAALARLHVVQPDQNLLEDIRKHATALDGARADHDSTGFSELSVIRETLTMLHGLPTYLFMMSAETDACVVRHDVEIGTTHDQTVQHALNQCADVGTRLKYLRRWISVPQKAAYMQSIQSSMQKLMATFASELGQLEQRYIKPAMNTVVSLMEMQAEVESIARPVLRLSDLIREVLSSEPLPRSPFTLLDALYDEACLTHMAGDIEVFTAIRSVFLAGLRIYLRTVEQWLKAGSLPRNDVDSFFVREATDDCELGDVWHKKFALRTSGDGRLCAPGVVQPFVETVFASGKAMAFLKVLDPQYEPDVRASDQAQGAVGFGQATRISEIDSFQPFEELIEDALRSWISAAEHDCATTVKNKLLYDAGTLVTLAAIDHAFFSRNGLLFQTFAEALFEQIRRHRKTWRDRFLLTELAQSTLGSVHQVDANSVTVSVTQDSSTNIAMPVVRALECIDMQYALPWPVQNITRSTALPAHSAAFIFLLQTYFAKHLLRPQLFELRARSCESIALPAHIQKALKLRMRLICFVDTLHAHVTATASLLHRELCTKTKVADGIDDMAAIWAGYEKRLQVCLLLAPNLAPIKHAVLSILELCERFVVVWATKEAAASTAACEDMDREFGKSISFITAGLRGVSRAGGEAVLEVLSERLEWCGG